MNIESGMISDRAFIPKSVTDHHAHSLIEKNEIDIQNSDSIISNEESDKVDDAALSTLLMLLRPSGTPTKGTQKVNKLCRLLVLLKINLVTFIIGSC